MKPNDLKVSSNKLINKSVVKEVKKFNTKGYFYQVDPFDDEYLKIKHSAYQKNRHTKDKENFVYNLQPQRMRVGFYEMKGCHVDEPKNPIIKRRILKTISSTNDDCQTLQQSKTTSQHSNDNKLISCLFKKYMKRKQRLQTKSERALVSIYSQVRQNPLSIQSNSRQVSQHSFKTSEGESRILSFEGKNRRLSKPSIQYERQNATIIAACRNKVLSRRGSKMRTIQ